MLGSLVIAISQGLGKNFIQVDFQSLPMSRLHSFFFYKLLCWGWYLWDIGRIDIMIFMAFFFVIFLKKYTYPLFIDWYKQYKNKPHVGCHWKLCIKTVKNCSHKLKLFFHLKPTDENLESGTIISILPLLVLSKRIPENFTVLPE